ncbi:hypothetical protein O0I10_009254 [Lichtheimia ornata]|uniref:RING-type domain-containing protein n=1 Tax=Lichtheimia ornata TaxID=688661 RepID=A0AAD7UX53_9FUNG|nr:uncharacterized protein O0I10_009254 [Lichtheimia ornata]KAJ8655047.1 hypothetical protein O0I10_009254 [Lichtheimia ornata]
MMNGYVRRIISLLLLGLALYVIPISCQSTDNPAFWEGARVYNAQGKPIDNSTKDDIIAISRDFQTIYGLNEQPLSPWRILVDYSTSCNSTNTTVEQLTALNHDNLGFYSTIRDLSIIGLVERGGGCNWSEKVYMARSLSSAINLNLTAIVISDNERPASADYNPYPITTISQQKYTFTNPLPDDRNATHMQDNDLHTTFGTTTTPPIGIYFIPKTYGDHLRSLIGDNTTVGNDERPLLQLSLIFSPIRLQSSEGDDANVFTRGYLSYVIALSVILFVAICAGFVFLRWWRIRERRAAREYEAQLSAHAANMQMRRKSKPLPVNIVNAIPIAHYTEATVKNPSCAICLEDYQEGETEVRILGCGHGFCVLCIDPWLTQKSTLCPICKWDCLPEEMRKSSTDTSDSGDHSNTTTTATATAAAAVSNTTIAANAAPSSTSLASTQLAPAPSAAQQSQEKNATSTQDNDNGQRSAENSVATKTADDDKNNDSNLKNDATTPNTALEDHAASSSGSSIPNQAPSQQKETKDDNVVDDASKDDDPITTTSATSTSDDTQHQQQDGNIDHGTVDTTTQSPPSSTAEEHNDTTTTTTKDNDDNSPPSPHVK